MNYNSPGWIRFRKTLFILNGILWGMVVIFFGMIAAPFFMSAGDPIIIMLWGYLTIKGAVIFGEHMSVLLNKLLIRMMS